jgi:transposase
MKPPLFVRSLTQDERLALDKALRSNEAFTLRRAQILRLSCQRQRPREIADHLGCSSQGVREVIHAFEERGLACLERAKMGPTSAEVIFDEQGRERLLDLAHQSPRDFGRARSVWTLESLAEVAFEEGLTPEQVSHETIRQAILALGSSWKRAKDWITSPDPQYALKKSNATT